MPLPRSPKWVSGLRPISEQGSNPKDEYGAAKLPLGLVSPTASAIQALCMQDGMEKYGPYNYRAAKVQALIYLEAAKRHLDALLDGEDFDPSTGKPHIGYLLATAQIYCDAWINGFLLDNRPAPGKAGMLHYFFARKPGDLEMSPEDIRCAIENIIRAPRPPDSLVTLTQAQGDLDAPRPTESVPDSLHDNKSFSTQGDAQRNRSKRMVRNKRHGKRR